MLLSLAAMFKRPLTLFGDSRVKFCFVDFNENWRASPFASGRKLLVIPPGRAVGPALRSKIFLIFFDKACFSEFQFAMSWRADVIVRTLVLGGRLRGCHGNCYRHHGVSDETMPSFRHDVRGPSCDLLL
jgi:hypothetical protein